MRKLIAGAVLAAASAAGLVVPAAEPAEAALPASLPCAYFAPHGILDDVIVSYVHSETADAVVYFCVARHGNTSLRHRYWVIYWPRSRDWTWHPA
jgi:hypothetical protein